MLVLAKVDKQIANIIKGEEERQRNELELIASENYVSGAVREAMGSVLTNKYSEGYVGRRYYGGQRYIDEMELLAQERAQKLFGAEYVNVQPLSGSPANLAVYLAVLNVGERVMGFDLNHGGHLSHGHPLNFSGKLYDIVSYGVDPETELVDMVQVRELAQRTRPKMIIAGFSAYARAVDWQSFRQIADEVGAILLGDISHIAGLVAGGVVENPIPFCDIVTTTTHKTLRGPRGAIIMSKERYAKDLARAVFPGVQGGPHNHINAGKAVAFAEALQPEFRIYAQQVVTNAQALAGALQKLGYRIVSGGTDNHLMLVDVMGSVGVTGCEAELALEQAGLSVNKNMIPFDERKPLDPSGIRLGTAAATTRGMGEIEMLQVAKWFDQALKNKGERDVLSVIATKVKLLLKNFPVPS